MRKETLRQQMRELKRQFSQQALRELSLPLQERLRQRLSDSQVILGYHALPDEVSLFPLLDEWVGQGKTVLLPRVVSDVEMELRQYTGPADLREGAFHIMEPIGPLFTDFNRIDVVLVPGMAFDAAGNRLGRGKGYYDRFLSAHPMYKIGVCFDFQRVPEVPVDGHDVVMDEVIS